MSNVLEQQAVLAAERVSPEVTEEMGITAIIGILTQVFTFLASCKNRETPDPAAIQASVVEENETNPKRLRRRTARRIRASSEAPMTISQSFALARASIEQAIEMPAETAMACAMSVRNDLVVEGD